jgi:type IV pilus assembly protein PilP
MRAVLYLSIIFLIFLSGGCKKEQAPGKKPAPEKVQQAKTAEEQKVSQEAKADFEAYQYDAKGKRDPFLSLVAKAAQKPVKKKGASPFESYEIDEVELLAVASDKQKSYALILLPDKKTYTITEGMTLGMQGGKVQKITRDSVHIKEFVKDYRGDIKPRDVILKLHKGEE